MIIRDIHLDNSFCHVDPFDLDLSEYGIYRIYGPIGSGKTTIIEKILFGKFRIEFLSEKEREMFCKEKYKLIAYVPQNNPLLDITTEKYIFRGNVHADRKEMSGLLKRFGISESILTQNYSTLSGGERIKISIISALIKNTKYIVLDEPTNHLDDDSVFVLESILNELALQKTVLLVSHDDRLKLNEKRAYHIENGHVRIFDRRVEEKVVGLGKYVDSIEDNRSVRLNLIRVLLSVTRNIPHYVSILFLIVALTGLATYSNISFKNNYSMDALIEPGWILVKQDYTYYGDGLTERYVKARGLIVNEIRTEQPILLEEVEEIASLSGVDSVYIYDENYNWELSSEMHEAIQIGELKRPLLYSCPKVYFDEFPRSSICSVMPGFSYVYGRLPEDGKEEVALSLVVLRMFGGYDISDVKDAVGKKIDFTISGKTNSYTVVGIIDSDVAILSYDPYNQLGCYKYSEDTFDRFFLSQEQMYTRKDMGDVFVREMLLKVNPKMERTVLEQLMTSYPANDYDSYIYGYIWMKNYNFERYVQVLLPNLFVSIVVAVILLLVNRNALKYNYMLLRSYGDYYVDRKRIQRIYRWFTFYQYFLCIAIELIINSFVSPFAFISNSIVIINSLVIVLPLILSHYVFGRGEAT